MRIGLAHPGTPALPGAEFARIFLKKRCQKITLIICDEQITGFLDIFRNFVNELPLFASKRDDFIIGLDCFNIIDATDIRKAPETRITAERVQVWVNDLSSSMRS
jgi:hypothetical protein